MGHLYDDWGFGAPSACCTAPALLDSLVGEVERTKSEFIPFARMLEFTEQAQVHSDEIRRLIFLLTIEWHDANSVCTRHLTAVRRYCLPAIRRKIIEMPDLSLDPEFEPFDFGLDEMEPGIIFSRETVELWRGCYNFRLL